MSMRDVLDISAYLVLGPENTLGRPVADIAGQAISAGFTCVQVRSKECSARELIACTAAVADEIARLGATDRVALLVDDRLDVVYAARQQGVKVDGVHVGQTDIPVEACRSLLGHDPLGGQAIEFRLGDPALAGLHVAHLLDRGHDEAVLGVVARELRLQHLRVLGPLHVIGVIGECAVLGERLRAQLDAVHEEDHLVGVVRVGYELG